MEILVIALGILAAVVLGLVALLLLAGIMAFIGRIRAYKAELDKIKHLRRATERQQRNHK